ncbi:NAD(P)/FAD-dependent oxidoreductase [Lachnospiraceae bacterium MD1]|uniref:NAD(P)/FAD-dependent oxidoreductase n=1 Tax=Variimorphobacter saccharofermentans TaxID=2755051 RepID=A0A839K071_9FIRM|nr:NAD(P)/FAD-dependent oxidoreductase [Variimorphobacter saccharofermentans]MBB2183074.1 NAD(P)/FAD-dependent oxidoreductase [Variimorphobacter saccharofermentans]
MIQIVQLKLPIKHTNEDMHSAIVKALKLAKSRTFEYTIIKKSIDARKEEIKYIYTVEVRVDLSKQETEKDIVNKCRNSNVSITERTSYRFEPKGTKPLKHRPVIVGTGPAGLFSAWILAKHGYQPLVVERGYEVNKRVTVVEHFWEQNDLNPNCNVQFGEGGAGTFSDGKLNTMVKDAFHRYPLVMETFVEHGAPSDILYLNKPHIGTDKLRGVVENMRNDIIRMGGEVRFATTLTDILIENDQLAGIELNHNERISCEVLITAIGHSARDTFAMLLKRGIHLSPKAFAIGLRIEHKQSMISMAQYGKSYIDLPAADYKLTHQTKSGRGVYSFCMCPGGYVVNASSEPGHLVVNGMSNYARNGDNANSAIVVTVQPEDFPNTDPLSGVAFQRNWEKAAYAAGKGVVPVQLFGDLFHYRKSVTIGSVIPNIKGEYRLSNLTECLPDNIIEALKEGIMAFDKKIKGFADEEAILSGVESRTSSPVRIHRNEFYESNITGIYPCGEGAGYAGGITSAAIDGIKVFEAVADCYKPCYE